MYKQITIFNKNIDLEIGSVYVIFNNYLSQEDNLNKSKKIFYINLPFHDSIKVSQYVDSKDLSINNYENLIKKYNLKFIKPQEIIDVFNQLVYIIINEIENYDIFIIGTVGIAFESIKLILKELIDIAKIKDKIFIFVQNESKNIDILEKVDMLKLDNFDTWYVNKLRNNDDNAFIYKQR
ncbi:hypothetical protein C1631_021420 [Chryseobacterium phosphatilyticum]|uniref:Uncharacterized protein n=1 Tax=Chryseobacterium phosphatilyticum TaxID=475075 RepID=A0A316WQ48_9FLAO|nr:hypothetical protein [Chryseobacterium phosphatilyticum]PWN63544.1 hypothetical protein C1631_021420 [Chryseobacterium phosphatilyticum]